MAASKNRVVLKFGCPGGPRAGSNGHNAMMCGGCAAEIDVPHDLSGDQIADIMVQHRTICTLLQARS